MKKADHHVRECSPAAPIESKLDAASKPKQSNEHQMHKNVDQKTKDENKCHKCQETFDKCKGIILENPSLAFKDLLKLIKSKHRHQRHKQIEEDCVSLISDFLVETKDFGKCIYTMIYFYHFTKLFPERQNILSIIQIEFYKSNGNAMQMKPKFEENICKTFLRISDF